MTYQPHDQEFYQYMQDGMPGETYREWTSESILLAESDKKNSWQRHDPKTGRYVSKPEKRQVAGMWLR